MEPNNSVLQHRWEDLGLGKAPFKCVGMEKLPPASLSEANPSSYNAALLDLPVGYQLGTCAVCGTGINRNFLIHSHDGKRFAVGCECVNKVDDSKLISQVKALQRQAAAAARDKKRLEKWEANRIAVAAALAAQRVANGGKTDHEVRQEQLAAEASKRAAPFLQYAELLHDGARGFRDSCAASLRQGIVPQGKALNIMVEILSKLTTGKRRVQPEVAESLREFFLQA